VAEVELSGEGVLWTWTVQRFAPKSPPYVPPPGGFVPFVLGYVELPEGVRIEAVLDVAAPDVTVSVSDGQADEDVARQLGIGCRVRIGAGVGDGGGVPRGALT
jgi:uncharacterized OB-fold protein